ncbi:MAG: DUF5131 family protein [Anaerolineae bacterium]
MPTWNPWHGCRKYSEGCVHCYVYRMDAHFGRDPEQVVRTGDFDLPLRRDRLGHYKLAPGTEVFTCLTSDFLLEEADPWRNEAWAIIRQRPDVQLSIITKRIVRLTECLPPDWGAGYPNVTIGVTVESQRQAEIRMPAFLAAPVSRRFVICEPLLEAIDLSPWLDGRIAYVMVGGESGGQARVCDYEWVLDIRERCMAAGVGFVFKQTGARFRKDGVVFKIARHMQMAQARKAGIDTITGVLAEE